MRSIRPAESRIPNYQPPVTTLPDGSPLLRYSFVALTLAITVMFVAAVYWAGRRSGLEQLVAAREARLAAIRTGLWVALTGTAAARGFLQFEPPPTMLVLVVATLAIAARIAHSPLGTRLATGIPMTWLVGFQSFRIVVELLLHRAYTESLIPVQMSYSGRNFDIVSGVTALLVGLWLASGDRPGARRIVQAWNLLGFALLLNIVTIAMLSAPTPLRVFKNEPSSAWVTGAPWVWLPTVMVLAAILGHLLLFRRLAIEARSLVQG